MNLNDSICSPNFYSDTGFNVVLNWLKENCLCPLNEHYFTHLSPNFDIESIKDSQLHTDEFLSAFQRNNPLPLDVIPDISIWLTSLEISGFQLNPENFQQLYYIITLSTRMKKFLTKKKFPLWNIHGSNLISTKSGQSRIEKVFNDSFEIKDDASPELKQLFRSISSTEDNIKKTLQHIFLRAKEKNWLGGDQIVLRNGRSALPLKSSHKRKVKGIVQDQSATGQTTFVEPLEIIELNNQLSDLQFKIIEEKKRILQELTAFFYPMSSEIQETFNILKFIDRYFTIAKLSFHIKAIPPELNNKGQLNIKKAINPLFTLVGKNAVALNLELKDEKILLLSGPNAGGKTVVLKSLGLYALMAQCGLFIPAQMIQLPLFTQFMSDIGDGQSIENDLSTFSAHIQNLDVILKSAHENSLILLDELGTGTDPDAGSALSQTILESLLQQNSTVLATTHLGSLKAWAADEKGILNGGMIFDSDAMLPTYELIIGTPGASYALEISRRIGLSDNIINRSKELMGDGSVHLENILSDLEKERLTVDSLKKELHLRQKKLDKAEKETYEKENDIQKIYKKAKSSAAREAEEIILSARKEAENLISEIRKSQANSKSIQKTKKQLKQTLNQLRNQRKDGESESILLSKKDAIKGVTVYIPKLNSRGNIIHPPDKQNKVRVEANGITLTLKLSELQPAVSVKSAGTKSGASFSVNKISKMKSIQIDLRGKRVDEALMETEKFIDSALISGVGCVNILHGKGTGALMKAIHDYLKKQSCVTHFQFADDDKGGAGITVVELI